MIDSLKAKLSSRKFLLLLGTLATLLLVHDPYPWASETIERAIWAVLAWLGVEGVVDAAAAHSAGKQPLSELQSVTNVQVEGQETGATPKGVI